MESLGERGLWKLARDNLLSKCPGFNNILQNKIAVSNDNNSCVLIGPHFMTLSSDITFYELKEYWTQADSMLLNFR